MKKESPFYHFLPIENHNNCQQYRAVFLFSSNRSVALTPI